MATSGSYSFNLNKTQIISRALQLINIYNINDTIDADDYSYASDTLNMMIKSWEAEGIKMWKRRQGVLFTNTNQYSYQLGSVAGADHVTNTYVSTTVATANASGVTSVSVLSSTGFVVGMNIGLELDDSSRQWGTIVSIVGTTINLSFTTTNTAKTLNTVVAYSTNINRPLRVIRATLNDLKNNNQEVPLMDISFDKYFNLPQKRSPGRPNNFYYDKLISNGITYTGTLYLFPQPADSSVVLNFTYYDSIQDMINNTDTTDFPQEWLYALVFNLATELAYPYGKLVELQSFLPKAQSLKRTMNDFDNDDESMTFSFDDINRTPRM